MIEVKVALDCRISFNLPETEQLLEAFGDVDRKVAHGTVWPTTSVGGRMT